MIQCTMNHTRHFEDVNKKWKNYCFSGPPAMYLSVCVPTSFIEERPGKIHTILNTCSIIFYCSLFAAAVCLIYDPTPQQTH